MHPYPDFRSMRIVLESGLDFKCFLQKAKIIENINNRQPANLDAIPLQDLSPYGRQTEYHMDVAQALALRMGDREHWTDIAFLFDVLFTTDDMIANPGW